MLLGIDVHRDCWVIVDMLCTYSRVSVLRSADVFQCSLDNAECYLCARSVMPIVKLSSCSLIRNLREYKYLVTH